MASEAEILRVSASVDRFTEWLERYGEESYDYQSFFSSRYARKAKALYYRKPLLGMVAVSPMIFCETFVPSARTLFWRAQRFPIADAHYAMGFAFLHETYGRDDDYKRALHFLEVLRQTRSPGFEHYAWGYPFDWETRGGTIREGTPLITTVPYVYEAFRQVYQIDRDPKWFEIMQSVAEHAFEDYRDFPTSANASSCSYMPGREEPDHVVNANAYRSFLLTCAAYDFSEEKYRKVADRNLNFVLEAQNADGSWFYSKDGVRDFVDHFHTCFVMKALAKIEALTGNRACGEAIERGLKYYVKNLFDEKGLPLPFSRRPRMTVYRRELYDYAECINLGLLVEGRNAGLDRAVSSALEDVTGRWQTAAGSFRSRKLYLGWDSVPMHRWAQAQLFRSLSFYLCRNLKQPGAENPGERLQAVASQAEN